MEEKVKPVLGDKNMYPSDDLLRSVTGDKFEIWKKIVDNAVSKYDNITHEWRYYNDGKQWLFKIQHKKKTIFWSSVRDNTFSITFYFGNKTEPVIEGSDLPESIKEEFRTARSFGSIKPVTFNLSEDTELESIYKLTDLKTKIK